MATRVRRPQDTHEVINQPPPLEGYNAFDADPALREALEREGGALGRSTACATSAPSSARRRRASTRRRAQRNVPCCTRTTATATASTQVEYDPSMHWMLRLGVEREVNSLPWRDPRPGAHVVRDGAVLPDQPARHRARAARCRSTTRPCRRCARTPRWPREWEERLTLPDYDRFAQAGMVMTEKQGGSDLRANTTVAEPVGDGWYELTGHKWFCTHPVFDVFFTLAQAPGGITCFVAERPHPGFRLQRLKDKLGGRCLASSEVEFDHLPARILGEEGRGTAFMIEQIVWTRLDTMLGVAGMMRRAASAEAVWHTPPPRSAFGGAAGRPARDGATCSRTWRSSRRRRRPPRCASRAPSTRDDRERLPALGARGDEVLGLQARRAARRRGARVPGRQRLHREEAPVAQFYRDIQIGTVWEGSGNVVALDVLRAMAKEPEGLRCLPGASASSPRGADPRFDAHLDASASELEPPWASDDPQWRGPRRRRGPRARAPGEPAAAPCAARGGGRVLRRAPRRRRPRVRDAARAASTRTRSSSAR